MCVWSTLLQRLHRAVCHVHAAMPSLSTHVTIWQWLFVLSGMLWQPGRARENCCSPGWQTQRVGMCVISNSGGCVDLGWKGRGVVVQKVV